MLRADQIGRRIDGRINALHELRTEAMRSLTIRIRNRGDQAAVERLKLATGQTTAAGAIWRAIQEWPEFDEQLRSEREHSARLITALKLATSAEGGIKRAKNFHERAIDSTLRMLERHEEREKERLDAGG